MAIDRKGRRPENRAHAALEREFYEGVRANESLRAVIAGIARQSKFDAIWKSIQDCAIPICAEREINILRANILEELGNGSAYLAAVDEILQTGERFLLRRNLVSIGSSGDARFFHGTVEAAIVSIHSLQKDGQP